MTLAWRMYVCMCVCVCMGWQAGWERMCLVGGELLEGEGWARVRKKKTPGPATARVSSRLGEGNETKGRFVSAVLPQGREWIKRCFSAWAFVF